MAAPRSPSAGPVDAVRAVAALDDPSRRALFEFIRAARHPVTREQSADAVGISRKLAAFHLDKLVDVGLLTTHYDTGSRVRKVGRTPKVYEPADADIAVSIPDRRPQMLAEILVRAIVTARPGESAGTATLRVAHQNGRQLGESARAQLRPGRLGPERSLTLAETSLQGHGFQPHRESATCLRLRNCPFHPLAAQEPELICGLNHEFLSGFLSGMQAGRVQAVRSPRAGECCVELRAVDG